MQTKKLLWIVIPSVVLVGLIGWRFMQKGKEEAQLTQQAGQRQGGASSVEVAVAGPNTILGGLSVVGTAESPQRVQISPKTSGRIEYLNVREGDAVKPGQVLVRIDPSEIQAQVLQQQASVAEARSRLAQAQLTAGSTDVGVQSQIRQQRAGLTSAQADLNQVQRNYESQVAAADASVADARSRVESAQAGVKNARAEVDREQANLNNAQTRFNRIEGLYRQGFIAAQEVDDARTALEVQRQAVEVARGELEVANAGVASAQAQLRSAQSNASIVRRKGQADIAAARARVTQADASVDVAAANRAQSPAYRQNIAALASNVRAAEAQLAQARARLSETTLKSPINGTVTARSADPGALASPGTAVLVVQFLDWLYITGSVPIEDSAQLKVGRTAQVTFDALPGRTFVGPITHVNPAADVQSRQVSFRLRLQNTNRVLNPGMFGRIQITTQNVQAPVTIPREALRTSEDGVTTVMVVNDEDTAEERQVRVGATSDKLVQILAGVQAGERVITLTYRPVRDGQKVRIGGAEAEGAGEGGGQGRGGAGGGQGRGRNQGAGGGNRPQGS